MRHKLLVLTVKKFLQSVYIYGSYRKIKTGVPFFLDHPVQFSADIFFKSALVPWLEKQNHLTDIAALVISLSLCRLKAVMTVHTYFESRVLVSE